MNIKSLVIIPSLVVAIFSVTSPVRAAGSVTHAPGDCLANNVDGDLYPQPDFYCRAIPGNGTQAKENKPADNPSLPVTDNDVPVIVIELPELPIDDTDTPPNEIITVPDEPETPVVTPEPGNPGNDKPVGNAGEKCDKGMCENGNGTGEHGNSPND